MCVRARERRTSAGERACRHLFRGRKSFAEMFKARTRRVSLASDSDIATRHEGSRCGRAVSFSSSREANNRRSGLVKVNHKLIILLIITIAEIIALLLILLRGFLLLALFRSPQSGLAKVNQKLIILLIITIAIIIALLLILSSLTWVKMMFHL